MGITVASAETSPAVVYDQVHLASLTIEQPVSHDDSANPDYRLKITYLMYGVVEGVRHYNANVGAKTISIPDYYGLATQKAGEGDFDLANAMAAIELAVANIIEDQTGVVATVA